VRGIPTAIQGKVVGYVKCGKSVCSEIRCVTMKCCPQHMRDVSWDSSVNIVTGKELDDRGIGLSSQQRQEICLFSSGFRPGLGPMRSLILRLKLRFTLERVMKTLGRGSRGIALLFL